MALWNAIKSFVDRFLAIHYLTDAAVAADPELADYRAAFGELLKCPEVRCRMLSPRQPTHFERSFPELNGIL